MKSQATRFIVAAVVGAFALAAVVIPAVARPTSAYAAQITDRVVSAAAPSQGTDPEKKPTPPAGKRPFGGHFHGWFHGFFGANFDRFLSSETRLLDKDNKPVTIDVVAGVITAVSDTTLTIAPNGGGAAQTYTVNDQTRYFPPAQGDAKGLAAFKVGDKVMIRTNNGSVTIVAKHLDPKPRPQKSVRPAPTKEQLQNMHDRLQKQLDEINKKLAEQGN